MSYLSYFMGHFIGFNRYHYYIFGKAVFKPFRLMGLLCIFLWLIGGTVYGEIIGMPQIPPLPKQYKGYQIAPPDPSLPSAIKAFLGEWPEGLWEPSDSSNLDQPKSGIRARLIVLSVSTDSAEVLYGVSRSPDAALPGGWTKTQVKIVTDHAGRKFLILLPIPGNAIRFWVEGARTLKGRQLPDLELKVSKERVASKPAIPDAKSRCLETTFLRLLLMQVRFGH
jgi:hypothetical protein